MVTEFLVVTATATATASATATAAAAVAVSSYRSSQLLPWLWLQRWRLQERLPLRSQLLLRSASASIEATQPAPG